MKQFPIANDHTRELVSEFKLEFPDVSWAGSTTIGVFCFGNENGHVWTTDVAGQTFIKFPPQFGSGEPINGVAFSTQRWMSASTRNDVSLGELKKNEFFDSIVPLGAHHVTLAADGRFFAPLGLNGLMIWLPQDQEEQSVTISSSSSPVYIYRIVTTRTKEGKDYVIAATRRHGLGRMEYRIDAPDNVVSASTFVGLDVVDVCEVKYKSIDGFVAVGKDGTIILYSEVNQVADPIVVRFPEIKGVVYRVLSAKGYLFVLSSVGLYIMADLLDEAVIRAQSTPAVRMFGLPLAAIDMNLVAERWVLVVLTDRVIRIDIDLIASIRMGDDVARESQARPERLRPDWEAKTIPQRSRAVAMV